MSNITQQTIELAKQALEGQPLAKDVTTQGYNVQTGLQGYSLEAPAKSLFPVLTPFRNEIPRIKAPIGSLAAHWKAILGINVTNQRATAGWGFAGNQVSTKEKDFNALYKLISLGDSVQFDAEKLSQGFQNVRATAVANLLFALMIEEEKLLLGGQNFSLGTPSAPTLTPSNSGGSIGTVNVAVAVAARTMQGYTDGQSTTPSTQATTGALTGTTNSVTASVPYVQGAVEYDWYVGVAGGNLYYYGSTTINKITITSVPTQAAITSGVPTSSVPGFYSNGTWTAATTAASITADNSADPNAFNGLIATLVGNYDANGGMVANGAGTASGAYIKSVDGSPLTATTGTIDQIDAALSYLWANARLSPEKILVNSIDHANISNKIIASGGAYTVFKPNEASERQNVIGGALVSSIINKAVNGQQIAIETHPYLPQGTILIPTKTLPYPNNNVSNILEIETQLEYTQIEYAMSRGSGANGGPRYDFENRAIEAFKNYFPGSMAIIQNVPNA